MNSPHALKTEKELLELLQGSDESAFTHIYNVHSKKAFLAAYSTTRSRETAKEIVQEVFVSLWAARHTLTIKSSIEAYITGAVRYKVYDYFDKQTVRERYKNHVSTMRVSMVNSTEELLDFEELNSQVSRHIDTLPETTRRVFISSRFNGASIPEIAKESSLSVKAVEYHLTKALKLLRIRLARYQPKTSQTLIFLAALLEALS